MKKLFWFLVGFWLVFSVGMAEAAPFLVCDPNPGAEKYILEIDGTETGEIAAQADGSIHYNMASFINSGGHSLRAKAGNVWGWSAYSDPFDFNADAPGVPSGFGFSAD